MLLLLKRLIRQTLNRKGFQIVPLSQHPPSNFMGLPALDIQTILDIGANAGQFATRIHQVLPAACVVSFEPLGDAFASLQETFAREGIRGSCHPFALGDEERSATIHRHVAHSPSSSLLATTSHHEGLDHRTQKQHDETIQLKRLDDAVVDLNILIKPGLFIKMDVQGFEDKVIDGGMKTFAQAKAVLTEINLDPLYEGQADFGGLCQRLFRLGFRYAGNFDQWQDADGHIVAVDALFCVDVRRADEIRVPDRGPSRPERRPRQSLDRLELDAGHEGAHRGRDHPTPASLD